MFAAAPLASDAQTAGRNAGEAAVQTVAQTVGKSAGASDAFLLRCVTLRDCSLQEPLLARRLVSKSPTLRCLVCRRSGLKRNKVWGVARVRCVLNSHCVEQPMPRR